MATEEAAKPSPIPPYPEMILAAIDGLGDKNGSNKSAISKFMEEKYGELPPAHSSLLTAHLSRMKESGELIFMKNNYFRADSPDAPQKRGRGRPPKDPNAPKPPPKSPASSTGGTGRGRGRPPKPKNPLEAAVKQATAGMPKARGRPPKKAKTEDGAAAAPKPKPAPAPAPAGDGSTPVKRGRGRPPKVRPVVPSETAAA